jgi:hypothetical protein
MDTMCCPKIKNNPPNGKKNSKCPSKKNPLGSLQNEGITNQNGALVTCYWFILAYCPRSV